MTSPGGRVLCVEDDRDTSEMVSILLESFGYEATVAETYAEALRLAQSEEFDLYLLDIHLPDRSGLDLCRELCRLNPNIPVAILSAAAYDTDRLAGIEAGAAIYLTKPIDIEALESTLKWLMEEGEAGRKAH